MTAAREGIDRQTIYPLDTAVKMIKDRAVANFDETVEIALGLPVPRREQGAGSGELEQLKSFLI